MTYLIRSAERRRGRGSVLSAEEVEVRFARHHRPRRDLGFAVEIEEAGIDRSRLELSAPKALAGDGGPPLRAPRSEVGASAAALKGELRRLRPQEAEGIEALDGEIAELVAELAALRASRDEALRRAFSKGHVVTLAEVLAQAEAFEQRRAQG